MLLKVGHVFQAAPVITQIINENRPLPQKGAYRIARLYAKLKPEYDLIVTRRNTMIEAYGHKEMVAGPDVEEGTRATDEQLVQAPNFSVPLDKMPEFLAAWAEVANEEIEVAVEQIPLAQLSLGDDKPSVISAAELLVLDDLVAMTD